MINIYLYGNGKEAAKTLNRLKEFSDRVLVKGIIVSDKSAEKKRLEQLCSLDQVNEYDYIVIAVYKWREIYEILNKAGIPDRKIVLSAELYKTNLKLKDVFSENRADQLVESSYYRRGEMFKKEYWKQAVLNYPPEHITIGVTSACKNKCVFCAYHGESFRDVSKVFELPFSLKLSRFKEMVDMAYDGNVPHIHICATGEPFVNPDILEMLDYVIYRYASVSVQTEFWPALFERKNYLYEICRRGEYIDYITTDIFSADEEIHNSIKKGTSLSELISALKYISANSKIRIRLNIILTKKNYKDLYKIVDLMQENNIKNYDITVINLFTYKGSSFTAKENTYTSADKDICDELTKLKIHAEECNIACSIPEPADKCSYKCDHFWTKFQLWPVMGCEKEKYAENMIPMACAAVVNGNLNSLGYLCDYSDLMSAWNNKKIVELRKNLLKGVYPSEECSNCYLCHGEE